MRGRGSSFHENALESACHERGHVGEDGGEGKTPRIGEVAGFPVWVELLLVLPESLEITEMLPVPENKGSQAMSERSETAILQPGKGGHSEIEPAEAPFFPPEHEFQEEELHDARGRIVSVTHEIWRDLRSVTR